MSCLGNVIWFIFGGLIGGLSWLAAGTLVYHDHWYPYRYAVF